MKMVRFGMIAALLAAMVTGCNEPLDKPVVTFDTASANCEQPLALFKFGDEVKVVGDYAVDLEYQADGGAWFPLKRIVSAEQSGTEELFPVIGYGKMTKAEKGITIPTGYWADRHYRLWYPVYTDVHRWYWAPGTLPVVIGHGDIDWNVSSLKILVLAAIAGFVIDDLNIDVDLPFFGIGVEDDDVLAPPKAGVFGITRTGKYRCTVFANGYAVESEEFNLTMPSASCGEDEDSDNDGDPADTDCNDDDPTVNHAATETCNGKDDDCDGSVDEGSPDTDGDGIANCVDSTPYGTTAPTVNLRGPNPQTIPVGTTWVDPGIDVSDDLDTPAQLTVLVTGQPNTAVSGTYTVTYRVTDRGNNTRVANRTVVVTGVVCDEFARVTAENPSNIEFNLGTTRRYFVDLCGDESVLIEFLGYNSANLKFRWIPGQLAVIPILQDPSWSAYLDPTNSERVIIIHQLTSIQTGAVDYWWATQLSSTNQPLPETEISGQFQFNVN